MAADPVATPRHRRTPHRGGHTGTPHRARRRRTAGLVLAAIVCAAVGGLGWSTGAVPAPDAMSTERRGPGPAVTTDSGPGAAPGPTGARGAGGGATPTGPDAGAPDPRPDLVSALVGRAATLLRRWDAARAAAYAEGSVQALRDLYAAPAGRADVRLLRSYLARGYRVEGVRMQVLAVKVLDHRPGRWLLRVTDRLAGAAAVGHGRRVALPRDRAERQDVALVRGPDGRWRVGEVSEGPAPAPTRRWGAGR